MLSVEAAVRSSNAPGLGGSLAGLSLIGSLRLSRNLSCDAVFYQFVC